MARCYTGPPRAPAFNIPVNIWWGFTPAPPVGAPNIAALLCQLTPGELVWGYGLNQQMFLKLPKLTNIHWARPFPLFGADLVECPAGTGRFYTVNYVDDVGKGYTNEYRFAVITVTAPLAIPLP